MAKAARAKAASKSGIDPTQLKLSSLARHNLESIDSSETLGSETDVLIEKLENTNDFDEFLSTQVELEALKYKDSL